jgi:hypothetical protein
MKNNWFWQTLLVLGLGLTCTLQGFGQTITFAEHPISNLSGVVSDGWASYSYAGQNNDDPDMAIAPDGHIYVVWLENQYLKIGIRDRKSTRLNSSHRTR